MLVQILSLDLFFFIFFLINAYNNAYNNTIHTRKKKNYNVIK